MSEPRPVILTAAQVRTALAGEKVELRRKLRPGEWLFDGHPIGRNPEPGKGLLWRWNMLDWSTATLDMGPSPAGNAGPYWHVWLNEPDPDWRTRHRLYSRIYLGDRLWVREAWAPRKSGASGPPFKSAVMGWYAGGHDLVGAASDDLPAGCEKWCPASSMPRWASRLTLVVTGLRLEPGEARPFVVEARRA